MIIVCKSTSMPGRLEEQYINLTIGKNYTALSDSNKDLKLDNTLEDLGI